MSTALFILAAIIASIIVMSFMPGLQHFVKPIIDLLFTAIKAVAENGVAWAVFVTKKLWFAHIEVLQNLVFSAEQLDPSVAMRDKT